VKNLVDANRDVRIARNHEEFIAFLEDIEFARRQGTLSLEGKLPVSSFWDDHVSQMIATIEAELHAGAARPPSRKVG
jgi:hypothetical protein